jgi:D-alanine-D-alanine ligase
MLEETASGYEGEADMEYQIAAALTGNGHEVLLVGVHDDPSEVITTLADRPVDLVFNASEAFQNNDGLDYLLPALLESQDQRYTGSPPLGLMVTRNKAMSKKVLAHHGLKVPGFVVYRLREKVNGKVGINFPAIVKPLQQDASTGISQASIVRDRDQLAERVSFVHESLGDAAIVEEFIEGRELYVSMLGNGSRLEMLPIVELAFDKDKTKPEERIATQQIKWDDPYRKRKGIKSVFARPLSKTAQERIEQTCRTAYRALWLRDYARLDLRLDENDDVWVLEANANPYISRNHEVADSAKKAGMEYSDFIERIVKEAQARYRNGTS